MNDNIQDTDIRTFETRLLFLRSIFENLESQDVILARCIQHKLKRSTLNYLEQLHVAELSLAYKDPVKILNYIAEEV